MKIIENIELLKKLQPYIKEDTEYCIKDGIVYHWTTYKTEVANLNEFKKELKTLTTDEAIELLAGVFDWNFEIKKCSNRKWHIVGVQESGLSYNGGFYDTLFEAIEKMLEYLINNK